MIVFGVVRQLDIDANVGKIATPTGPMRCEFEHILLAVAAFCDGQVRRFVLETREAVEGQFQPKLPVCVSITKAE